MIVFRKSATEQVSGKHCTLQGCGDRLFWGELLCMGDCVRIPERLNNFRFHVQKVSIKLAKTPKPLVESGEVLFHLLCCYLDKAANGSFQEKITRINIVTLIRLRAKKYIRKNPSDAQRAEILLKNVQERFGRHRVRERVISFTCKCYEGSI